MSRGMTAELRRVSCRNRPRKLPVICDSDRSEVRPLSRTPGPGGPDNPEAIDPRRPGLIPDSCPNPSHGVRLGPSREGPVCTPNHPHQSHRTPQICLPPPQTPWADGLTLAPLRPSLCSSRKLRLPPVPVMVADPFPSKPSAKSGGLSSLGWPSLIPTLGSRGQGVEEVAKRRAQRQQQSEGGRFGVEGGAIPPGGGRLPPTPSQICSPQPTHIPARLGHSVLLLLRASQSSLEPQPSLAQLTHVLTLPSPRSSPASHPFVAPGGPRPCLPSPPRSPHPPLRGVANQRLWSRASWHCSPGLALPAKYTSRRSPGTNTAGRLNSLPSSSERAGCREEAGITPLPAQLLLPGQEDGVPGCPWGRGSVGRPAVPSHSSSPPPAPAQEEAAQVKADRLGSVVPISQQ